MRFCTGQEDPVDRRTELRKNLERHSVFMSLFSVFVLIAM